MMEKHTDTELLDFLQELLNEHRYTGMVILRDSNTGRGFRLHETSMDEAVSDVRLAIKNYMEKIGR